MCANMLPLDLSPKDRSGCCQLEAWRRYRIVWTTLAEVLWIPYDRHTSLLKLHRLLGVDLLEQPVVLLHVSICS